MISVVVGTGVGINSLVARRLGEQRQAEANNAASHGIVLGIISWLIIALLGAFGSRPFFMATTDNANIIEMGVSYTTIVTVFCLFTTIQFCIEKTLQATGNMIFPMCLS